MASWTRLAWDTTLWMAAYGPENCHIENNPLNLHCPIGRYNILLCYMIFYSIILYYIMLCYIIYVILYFLGMIIQLRLYHQHSPAKKHLQLYLFPRDKIP